MIEFDEEKILSEIMEEYEEKLSQGDIFQKTISYFEVAEKIYKDNAIINETITINQFYKLVIVEFVKSIKEDD
jgi:hypothetical protein